MTLNLIRNTLRRSGFLGIAAVFVLIMVVGASAALPHKADAAQITTRSLAVTSSANGSITTDIAGNAAAAGSGGNGQKTGETFVFTPTASTVGSVLFQYCTTPLPTDTCTAPTGLTTANVTSVTAGTSQGWAATYSVDSSTVLTGAPWNCTGSSPGRTNCLAIKAGSAGSETAVAHTVTIAASGSNYVTNPTTDNQTFFVRITTYASTAYTTAVDTGTVASSTAQQIDVTAKVQETLNFSVGSTVTAPTSACTAFSDTGALNLGDSTNHALSFSLAYTNNSYFRVSTNATHGTAIQYSGDTLKSGSNSITALTTTPTSSSIGTSQFGIGVDTTDTQSGSGYSFTSLTGTAPYGSGSDGVTVAGEATDPTNKWAYDTTSVTTPKEVASSTGIITCDTGSISYLANIAATTPPGVYTATVTYLAVPKY